MTIQLSTQVRNARLDAVEASIGASPVLKLYSGSVPANVAAARTGTLLATIALPADWMQNAAGAVKAMSGTWTEAAADGTGVAGYYTIFDSAANAHIQGTVTLTGGGGDLLVDNVNFQQGQSFTVTAYSWQEPNG